MALSIMGPTTSGIYSITSFMRVGIEVTNRSQMFGLRCTDSQTSLTARSIALHVRSGPISISSFIISHRFSLGLILQLLTGQSITLISGCLLNHSVTTLEVCIRLLSWTTMMDSPSGITIALTVGSITFSTISIVYIPWHSKCHPPLPIPLGHNLTSSPSN